jgi:uncharacterized protein HemY
VRFGIFTMNPLFSLGKVLIIIGVVIAGIGIILVLRPEVPWLGKLPGDILIKKDNFRFYFPVTTCIIISIILTLLFYLFKR